MADTPPPGAARLSCGNDSEFSLTNLSSHNSLRMSSGPRPQGTPGRSPRPHAPRPRTHRVVLGGGAAGAVKVAGGG